MATHDIFMPALSSTMTEGKIVEWLKKPGDKVERGESVLTSHWITHDPKTDKCNFTRHK